MFVRRKREAKRYSRCSLKSNGLGRGRWTGVGWAVRLRADVNLPNANHLFASLIWGSVGLGYFIFGKREVDGEDEDAVLTSMTHVFEQEMFGNKSNPSDSAG